MARPYTGGLLKFKPVFKVAVMMNFDPRETGLPSNCFAQRDAGSFGSLASPNKTKDNFDITHELVKQHLQDQTIERALVQTIAEKYFPDLAGSPLELARQLLGLVGILQTRIDDFNDLRTSPRILFEVWNSDAMELAWDRSKLRENQERNHSLDFAMEAVTVLSSMDWKVACLKRSIKDAEPNLETVTQQVDSIIAAVSKSRESRLQNSYSQQLCSAVDALVLATAENKLPLDILKHLNTALDVFKIRPVDVTIKYWGKMKVNTYAYGYGYSAVLGNNDELLKFILKNHPAEIFDLATKQLEPEQVARVQSCIPGKAEICQYINEVAAAAKDKAAVPGMRNPAHLIATVISLLEFSSDFAELIDDIRSGKVPTQSSFKGSTTRPSTNSDRRSNELVECRELPPVPSNISIPSKVEELIDQLSMRRFRRSSKFLQIFTPEKTWEFLLSAVARLNTDSFEFGQDIQHRIGKILRFLEKKTNFNINSFDPKTEMTLLMHAAAAGNEYFVEVLKDMGADPTLVTENGKSAADVAEATGHIRLSKLLREDAQKFKKS